MKFDLSSVIEPLLTLLTGGGCGWLLKSSRRKGEAEATASQQSVFDTAMNQLSRMQEEYERQTATIHKLSQRLYAVEEELHRLNMRYTATRCDLLGCPARQPRPGATDSASVVGENVVVQKVVESSDLF